MFAKLLIANRGEIAVRVARTCRRLGIATVAVHSDADARALHVETCDEAVRIGPAPSAESYLRGERIIDAALATGAQAIHPGYGFLSENADFAEAVIAAGLVWVGPPPAAIRAMGLKDAAKSRMEAAGVPVVPGYHGERQEPDFLAGVAEEIGWPVLIKARAGGGGKGMRRVERAADFADALESAAREGRSSFGDPRVLIEKYVATPRHIEVQVFADAQGNAVHLFERDCSLQRRHQKVIEEAPAPGLSPEMRAEMGAAAVRAAQAVGYAGAGTVEFIADASAGLRADRFYFMEMNTRLQVEHPVTEAVTGLDLVELQLKIAAGEPLPFVQDDLNISGWAVEARLYAEDPAAGFLPATGRLARLALPEDVRVDAGVREGDAVTPHYDPMIAKLIAHAPTRDAAFATLAAALDRTEAAGCVTNAPFLARLLRHPEVAAGRVDTGLIDRAGAALAADPEPGAAVWALGAAAALGLAERPADADPWSGREAFRAWGAPTLWARLALRGADATVSLTREGDSWRAATPAGDVVLAVEPVAGGGGRASRSTSRACPSAVALSVVLDGRRAAARAVAHGDRLTLFFRGVPWVFTRPDPLTEALEHGPGGDAARAPMPGLVKAVHVSPGQSVEAGDRLATMEAMKMELALRAPRAGTVETVAVAEGDQVEEGALLVALAPEDGGA